MYHGIPKPRNYNDIHPQKQTKIVSDQAGIAQILNKINNNQISEIQKNDPLANKQTKVISDSAGITDVLNMIDNKNQAVIQQKQKQQQQVVHELKYVISAEELKGKAQAIVQYIQININTNPEYNYYKLLQFVYTMYEQYGQNSMAFMIIVKGLIKFNKKQMIKLPEDKIDTIVQYIISQVKK